MARELLLEGVTRRNQAKRDGAYLRLCAGSVEMIRTLFLVFVSCTAREHDVVVLPTPPFPPTKILLLMKKRHVPPLQFFVLYDVSQRSLGDIALVFHGRRILCVQRVFVCGWRGCDVVCLWVAFRTEDGASCGNYAEWIRRDPGIPF